jgi:hypothetical protein
MRVGTADRRILYHGALIEDAPGNHGEARLLVGRALDGHAAFDPLLGPRHRRWRGGSASIAPRHADRRYPCGADAGRATTVMLCLSRTPTRWQDQGR